MRKSKCKYCRKGIVLNPECDKVVSEYYCEIDAYDEEIGCEDCQYNKKESEVR
jgi:hypothetical protein